MTVWCVLDAAGRRRSPATLPGYHAGRPPCNKGMRYPADPPTMEEIVAAASEKPYGCRKLRNRAVPLPGSTLSRALLCPLQGRQRRACCGSSREAVGLGDRRLASLDRAVPDASIVS
jgi:hypothetical protein